MNLFQACNLLQEHISPGISNSMINTRIINSLIKTVKYHKNDERIEEAKEKRR